MISGSSFFGDKFNRKIATFTIALSNEKILTIGTNIPDKVYRFRQHVASVIKRTIEPHAGLDFSVLCPNGSEQFSIGVVRDNNESESVDKYNQEFSKLLNKKVRIIIESKSIKATVENVNAVTSKNEINYHNTMTLKCEDHTARDWHIGAPVVGFFPRTLDSSTPLRIYGLIISYYRTVREISFYSAIQLDEETWKAIYL